MIVCVYYVCTHMFFHVHEVSYRSSVDSNRYPGAGVMGHCELHDVIL